MNDPRKTTYQLHIALNRSVDVSVGKLGCFRFPAGNYIYTGSAKNNIDARINRHLSDTKKTHWHIDYLLLDPAATIIKVTRSNRSECTLNNATPGDTIVPGFGSSDCRSGCCSHLKYLGSYR